jgi:hypothetical protein
MNPDIQLLITEIELWLKSQAQPEPQSGRWYALGNLEAFVSAIKTDPSESAIAKASWILGHRLTDQYDWPAEDVKVISQFLTRAERIERGAMKNG